MKFSHFFSVVVLKIICCRYLVHLPFQEEDHGCSSYVAAAIFILEAPDHINLILLDLMDLIDGHERPNLSPLY